MLNPVFLSREARAGIPYFQQALSTELFNLQVGDYLFFPSGWVGHAIVLQIERQPNQLFSLRLYNTGEGAENHASALVGVEDYIYPYLERRDISIADFEQDTFYVALQLLQDRNEPYSDEYGPLRMYQLLFPSMGNAPKEEVMDYADFIQVQRSGTCAYRSIEAFLRMHTPESLSSQHLEWEVDFKVLSDFFEQKIAQGQPSELSTSLFHKSLETFTQNTLRLHESSVLTQGEFDYALERIETMSWVRSVLDEQNIFTSKLDDYYTQAQYLAPLQFQQIRASRVQHQVKLTQTVGYQDVGVHNWSLTSDSFVEDLLSFSRKISKALLYPLSDEFIEKEGPDWGHYHPSLRVSQIVDEFSAGTRLPDMTVLSAIRQLVLKMPLNPDDDVWRGQSLSEVGETINHFSLLSRQYLVAVALQETFQRPVNEFHKNTVSTIDFLVVSKLLSLTDMLLVKYPQILPQPIPRLSNELMEKFLTNNNLYSQIGDPVWQEEWQSLKDYWTDVPTISFFGINHVASMNGWRPSFVKYIPLYTRVLHPDKIVQKEWGIGRVGKSAQWDWPPESEWLRQYFLNRIEDTQASAVPYWYSDYLEYLRSPEDKLPMLNALRDLTYVQRLLVQGNLHQIRHIWRHSSLSEKNSPLVTFEVSDENIHDKRDELLFTAQLVQPIIGGLSVENVFQKVNNGKLSNLAFMEPSYQVGREFWGLTNDLNWLPKKANTLPLLPSVDMRALLSTQVNPTTGIVQYLSFILENSYCLHEPAAREYLLAYINQPQLIERELQRGRDTSRARIDEVLEKYTALVEGFIRLEEYTVAVHLLEIMRVIHTRMNAVLDNEGRALAFNMRTTLREYIESPLIPIVYKALIHREIVRGYIQNKPLEETELIELAQSALFYHTYRDETLDHKIAFSEVADVMLRYQPQVRGLFDAEDNKPVLSQLYRYVFGSDTSPIWTEPLTYPYFYGEDEGRFFIDLLQGRAFATQQLGGTPFKKLRERKGIYYDLIKANPPKSTGKFVNHNVFEETLSNGERIRISRHSTKLNDYELEKLIDGQWYLWTKREDVNDILKTELEAYQYLSSGFYHWAGDDELLFEDITSGKMLYRMHDGVIERIDDPNIILGQSFQQMLLNRIEHPELIFAWIDRQSGELKRLQLPRYELEFSVEYSNEEGMVLKTPSNLPGDRLALEQNSRDFPGFSTYIELADEEYRYILMPVGNRDKALSSLQKSRDVESVQDVLQQLLMDGHDSDPSSLEIQQRKNYIIFQVDQKTGRWIPTERLGRLELAALRLWRHDYREALAALRIQGSEVSSYTADEQELLGAIIQQNTAQSMIMPKKDYDPRARAVQLTAAAMLLRNSQEFDYYPPIVIGHLAVLYTEWLKDRAYLSEDWLQPADELLLLSTIYKNGSG